jgi:acyl-CoA hydrolase
MVEDVLGGGGLRHVSSAYLTYVAFDLKGNKFEVPQVVPESDHQKRRFEDAVRRRELRAEETQRKREIRAVIGHAWNL